MNPKLFWTLMTLAYAALGILTALMHLPYWPTLFVTIVSTFLGGVAGAYPPKRKG